MNDKPIIFSGPMVRALLEGRKTQTRRVLKPQPYTVEGVVFSWEGPKSSFLCGPQAVAANLRDHGAVRYAPGDRLYVREAWRSERGFDQLNAAEIKADYLDAGCSRVWAPIFYEVDAARVNFENGMVAGRYRHARFMPRWASRLTLTVTEVWVQRLQDISEEDAKAEGAMFHDGGRTGHSGWRHDFSDVHANARSSFARLWKTLHGADAWDQNPWCVAISFTVKKGNIDAL